MQTSHFIDAHLTTNEMRISPTGYAEESDTYR